MATVGAALGGMLASAVIKVVIGQINSTIAGEIKLHKNMRKDLEGMKMTLESVEAVLSDAERRSIADNSALLWLKRLKGAMNDISDMLEDFEADTNLNMQLSLLNYNKLEELPGKMRQLTQLQSLTLLECRSMTSLPEWLGELTSLSKLEIVWCPGIRTLPDSIQQLTNLQQLEIRDCHRLSMWCEAEENKIKLAHIGQMHTEDKASPREPAEQAEPAEPQHCGCLRF